MLHFRQPTNYIEFSVKILNHCRFCGNYFFQYGSFEAPEISCCIFERRISNPEKERVESLQDICKTFQDLWQWLLSPSFVANYWRCLNNNELLSRCSILQIVNHKRQVQECSVKYKWLVNKYLNFWTSDISVWFG